MNIEAKVTHHLGNDSASLGAVVEVCNISLLHGHEETQKKLGVWHTGIGESGACIHEEVLYVQWNT